MDCSKTVDFFPELKRLCDSRTACTADAANKEQCPMFGLCKHSLTTICKHSLTTICAEDAIEPIEILQRWSDEHPKKTYVQDFFEKFPKAQSDSDGTPLICRKTIYGGECPKDEECDYTGVCYRCWSEPLNDE